MPIFIRRHVLSHYIVHPSLPALPGLAEKIQHLWVEPNGRRHLRSRLSQSTRLGQPTLRLALSATAQILPSNRRPRIRPRTRGLSRTLVLLPRRDPPDQPIRIEFVQWRCAVEVRLELPSAYGTKPEGRVIHDPLVTDPARLDEGVQLVAAVDAVLEVAVVWCLDSMNGRILRIVLAMSSKQ